MGAVTMASVVLVQCFLDLVGSVFWPVEPRCLSAVCGGPRLCCSRVFSCNMLPFAVACPVGQETFTVQGAADVPQIAVDACCMS